jgi:hypothetical protein
MAVRAKLNVSRGALEAAASGALPDREEDPNKETPPKKHKIW